MEDDKNIEEMLEEHKDIVEPADSIENDPKTNSADNDNNQEDGSEPPVDLGTPCERQNNQESLNDRKGDLNRDDPPVVRNSEDDDDEDDPQRQIEFGTLAEQKDETYYDHREDANDDLEKGRIKFPKNLYGRNKELREIHDIFAKLNSDDGTSQVIFLGGYSGTGKSALVDEFMKQLSTRREKNEEYPLRHIIGKFNELKAGDPFSALAHALKRHVDYLIQSSDRKDLRPLRKRLNKARIYQGSDNAEVLKKVLIPNLDGILPQQRSSFIEKVDGNGEPMTHANSSDLNVIKFAFQTFIHAIAAEGEPVIMFLDDLQWADQASFDLISGLLNEKSSKHVLFIGAYRPNEIDTGHQLTKLMKDVGENKGPGSVNHMEIFNLSPDSIAEFIADAVERTKEEVGPIAEAVYSKTLGNIFFVRQALEELVRRNAIYFDVICYEWQFGDVTRVDIEKFLSDDVLEMVLSKLQTLPEALQAALSLAGYTSNTIGLDLLKALLSEKSIEIEPGNSLKKMMDLAYEEGLVLHGDGTFIDSNTKCAYKFAHDRIREASCAAIPAGDERDQLLLHVSKVLLDRGSAEKDSWMLFTAAQHLNSLPSAKVPDIMQLVGLNFTVGKIAASKGAFNEAAIFYHAGVDRLDNNNCWNEHYALCLDLKERLMEAELFLGNMDSVLEIANEIFEKGKSLTDKSRAYYCYLDATNKKNNRDHNQSADMALDILELFNIKVPKNPSSLRVKRETFRFNLAFGRRSMLCLADFPITTDPTILAPVRLASMALTFAVNAKRGRLSDVLGRRLIRLALQNKVITKDVPFILGAIGGGLRQRGNYRDAVAFANAAINMMDRFPYEQSTEFLKGKMAVYSLGCLRMHYKDAIETNMELHRLLYAKGESLYSMATAMMAMFAYMNASLRLNSLYESKLAVLEGLSENVGQKTFGVVFGTLRQTVYNLEGGEKASCNPVEFKGAAFDEETVQAQFEGGAQKMNSRDIGMFRLMLAVFFDDHVVMAEMLDRLDEFPIFDIIIERQHVRMTYVGLASLILGQKSKLHKKWAKECMSFFGKLARFGSSNGQPVYACLKALDKPSVASFEEAIQMCANEGLTQLLALMNERCGMMLLNQNKRDGEYGGEDYLKCAIWLYNDWGAIRKVHQLQSRYEFLRSAGGEKMPSQLSGMMRHVAGLTMPRSSEMFSEMRSAISNQ